MKEITKPSNWKRRPLALVLSLTLGASSFAMIGVPRSVQAADDPSSAINTSEGSHVAGYSGLIVDPELVLQGSVLTGHITGDELDGASVMIDNLKEGDGLSFTDTANIKGKYNKNTGILTLTGAAAVEEYQKALRNVTFSTTAKDVSERKIIFTLGSALPFSKNGHFYEYISQSASLTWHAAKTEAESKKYFGRQGYLVTITSAEENGFVAEKTLGLGWIGAADIERIDYNDPNAVTQRKSGDWRWVTGPEGLQDEGKGLAFWKGYVVTPPMPNVGVVEGMHQNWDNKEPNDSTNEYVAHIFGPGKQAGKWNDYNPKTSVKGYVIEYGGMNNDETFSISATKTIEDPFAVALAIEQPSGTEPVQVTGSKPVIAGKAAAGSNVTVVIKDNNGTVVSGAGGPATVDADGNWTFKPDQDLLDGKYTIEVTAAKDDKEITKTKNIDVQIPVPVASIIEPSGTVFIPRPEISGMATPDSKVTIEYKDKGGNNVIKTVDVDSDGKWNHTPDVDLAEGATSISVTAVKDGKTSVPVTKQVTVDTSKPAVAIDQPSGSVFQPRPTFEGTATPGSKVTITYEDKDGNNVTETVDVGEDGKWSHTPETDLAEGTTTIGVTAEKDGKTSAPVTQTVTVDTTKPAVAVTSPTGSVYTNRPTIEGTATPGATVTVKISDEITLTATADEEGNWSVTPEQAIPDGDYNVEITAEKDQKQSTISEPLTVDTRNLSTDTGLQLNSWNGTQIELRPVIGKANEFVASVTNSVYAVNILPESIDPDAKIEVSVNNKDAWQDVPNGEASGNLPLNEGANTIIVKVTDSRGNVTSYTLTVIRAYRDSGTSGTDGGSTPAPSTPAPVTPKPEANGIETSVNGQDNTFATGVTSTSEERTTTAVQVDLNKLKEALAQGKGQKLSIHAPKDGDMNVEGLTAEAVKELSDAGASLEISNPLAIYPVPGGKMDLSGVAKQLGNAALDEIAVHIDIARSSDDLISKANNQAAAGGYELLVPPVDLNLTFSHDGKTAGFEQLNGYAGKYIALPEGIDPNRITTGVIVNPDGSVFHVPTVVTKINNRYYAYINDLRSSASYSVIWNPQDFDDVRNHWGQADVNNIAARLDLAGTGNNTFSPDRNVSRSEFSEIVVLGLGLMRQNAPQNIFPDVPNSAWYRNAVAIANEFDIVRGFDDGNFHGNQQITREQGIAMIARAYNLINPQAELGEDAIDSMLAKYGDSASVSAWAKADVARMIKAGIVQGHGQQLLNPQANMTRAETAALIARLLKSTELIDK